MAEVTGAGGYDERGIYRYKWTGLANGDTGSPVRLPNLPKKSVQVTGTFGTSGSVSFEGSNDNTNYVVLDDQADAAITLTAAGLVGVRDNAEYVKPVVTAGDGTTALDVVLIASK
jgi:hypothetical protein